MPVRAGLTSAVIALIVIITIALPVAAPARPQAALALAGGLTCPDIGGAAPLQREPGAPGGPWRIAQCMYRGSALGVDVDLVIIKMEFVATTWDGAVPQYCRELNSNLADRSFESTTHHANVTVLYGGESLQGQLRAAARDLLAQLEGISQPCTPKPSEPPLACNTHTMTREPFEATDPTLRWVLIETRVNPDAAPLQRENARLFSLAGTPGTRGSVTTYDVEPGASSVTERVRRLNGVVRDAGEDNSDGDLAQDYTVRFDFAAPPGELVPGRMYELSVSGDISDSLGEKMPQRTFHYAANRSGSFGKGQLAVESRRPQCAMTFLFLAPLPSPMRPGLTISTRVSECVACTVEWVYEQRTGEIGGGDSAGSGDSSAAAAASATPGLGHEPESTAERLDRSVAENLADYMVSRGAIEPKLAGLYQRADSIMELLRIWRWDLEHGSDEDKEQARLEIAALQEEMAQLLADFEQTVGDLYAALDAMDAHFVTSPLHPELLVTLNGYRSELNLLRINLVLRSGNVPEFDRLFREYATDDSIAPQVYVANAFRQLMDGNMRIALESVRKALERDPANATARQLRRDIELSYLGRIRDQLAREMGENARLFNDKLNGHGSEGVGQFFVDVFTTAPAESALAVAGYCELLESVAGLNIDEAVSQIGGIRLLEDLLASGFALEELNSLSVDRMTEIAQQHYNREISQEQARRLRDRVFEAYGNVDVNALRRGEVTQFNVDVGRDYFDTGVLQQGASDFVLRQFSAWDTFLTFAPSAQLGRLANTGLAARLGLSSSSTLQQGLQRGLRIQELGQRIYQTPVGAAAVDAVHSWRGFETMVADAIKQRVGDVAYAGGSAAVSAALRELSAPARAALTEDLRVIGDYYLGAETVGNIEATTATLGAFFDFVGLNAQELERGAYGAEEAMLQRQFVDAEVALDNVTLNSDGVAAARGAQQGFEGFEAELAEGGDDYLANLSAARRGLALSEADPNIPRRTLASRAGQTLGEMERAAEALRGGDREAARQIWEQMQQGVGAQFERSVSDRVRRVGELGDLSRRLGLLAPSQPTDRSFAGAALGRLQGAAPAGTAPFLSALTAAGLQAVPEGSASYRLSRGETGP